MWLFWNFMILCESLFCESLCLENPMDGGAWWAAVHGVAKSRTRLSDFPSTFHFHALEKEMASHSSVLAWRIPVTGEPGGLPYMGSRRVGHDWSDLAAAAAAWNRYLIGGFNRKTVGIFLNYFIDDIDNFLPIKKNLTSLSRTPLILKGIGSPCMIF